MIILQKDKLGTLYDIYKFLKVNPNFLPSSLQNKKKEGIYNLERLKFFTLRNKFIFDYNFDNTRMQKKKVTILSKLVINCIRQIDKVILKNILKNKKPQISQELNHILQQKFCNDILFLEELIGKNLDDWK